MGRWLTATTAGWRTGEYTPDDAVSDDGRRVRRCKNKPLRRAVPRPPGRSRSRCRDSSTSTAWAGPGAIKGRRSCRGGDPTIGWGFGRPHLLGARADHGRRASPSGGRLSAASSTPGGPDPRAPYAEPVDRVRRLHRRDAPAVWSIRSGDGTWASRSRTWRRRGSATRGRDDAHPTSPGARTPTRRGLPLMRHLALVTPGDSRAVGTGTTSHLFGDDLRWSRP